METKNKAKYLLIVDYLSRMEHEKLISSLESDTVRKMAAVKFGIETVWQ